MTENNTSAVHWSFWVVAGFALIWNALGGVNYLMQMNTEFVATLPDTHRAIIIGRPAWATGGFAIGVFGGALGGLLLLLRKPAAFYVLVASLLGVAVTMVHTAGVANSVKFSAPEIFVMLLLPLIVAAYLVWYAKRARSKGWIR